MRLLLIRHGESEHSIRRLVAGDNGCPGLTELGRAQAPRLRDRLREEARHYDLLLSSTVPRAQQTAEILAPALSAGAPRIDCDLCEMHVGDGDGMRRDEFIQKYGSFDPIAVPDRPLSPGSDSWNTFNARVRATLAALAERHPGETVAAVTHAGFVVRTFLELFDVPRPGTGTRFDPDFTSITEWDHVAADGTWRLIRANDTAHLHAG
ncbi:histidine phosphatase family protein [Luteipulveratus mongoliensis]|uniref:histidine phosphatase family protein n=1 Tax=Luteipulveratus mongoliensis TaxID=571913 RepID=UPI000696A2B2|nr:histidine phosphatase family protein [Luteipulveratus mongoliensis]